MIPDKFTLEIDRVLYPEHYARYDYGSVVGRAGSDLRVKGVVPSYRAQCSKPALTTEQKLCATLHLVSQLKELELALLKLAIDTAQKLKDEKEAL